MSKLRKQGLNLILTLLLLSLPFAGWTQRWEIFDWWRLRSYQAPSEIQLLADRITMTDYARRLFYVYRAELLERDSFNQFCRHGGHSIVLGCYVSNRGIYIFNVSDLRLNGIKEVTAAHEVLHAAYDRLTAKERARIDILTARVYDQLEDKRILDTVASYRERDESVVANELHSIIGTEVRDIGTELEDYYARYFHNRLVVVDFAEGYEKAFTERKERIKQYDEELKRLKANIDSLDASLASQLESLNAQRSQMDALLAAQRHEEYNARVPGYNASVRAYNNTAAQIRNLIDSYNRIVKERNAIVLEENELIKAIDSRPGSIPTQ